MDWNKIENILISLTIFFVAIFTIFIIFITIEMLNDHYCYTLPIDEYHKDIKCERYWNEWNR